MNCLHLFSINFFNKCVSLKGSQSGTVTEVREGTPCLVMYNIRVLNFTLDHVHEAVCAADSVDNVQFARYFRKSTRCTLKS